VGLLTGNIRLGAEIKLRHFNLWDLATAPSLMMMRTGTASRPSHASAAAGCSAIELRGEELW